jgi:chromatin structure-remodeling complex protein RSC7
MRRKTLNGVYDPHTNMMHYPSIMQPTHARWERVPDIEAKSIEEMNGSLHSFSKDHNHEDEISPDADARPASIFAPVKPAYSRNFLIVDTLYENPPYSHLGTPGPDGCGIDTSFNGLSAISDELKDLLPFECRKEFNKALSKELEWKEKWTTEAKDSMRRAPVIDKGLIL